MAYTTLLPDLGPCAAPSHKQRFFQGPPSENRKLQCALESHHVFAVVDIHFAQRPQRIFQLLLTTGQGRNPPSCIQLFLEDCTSLRSKQSCNLCFQFLHLYNINIPSRRTSSYRSVVFCVHPGCRNLVDLPLHDAWRWLCPDSFHQYGVMFRRQPLPKHVSRVQARSFLCIFNEQITHVQQMSIHGSSRVPAGQ